MARWHHRKGAIKEPCATNTGDQFVIIGPYGNVWHAGAFPTVRMAETYLCDFWRGISSFDISEWRVAAAVVEVKALEPSWKFGGERPAVAESDAPNPSPKGNQ